MVNDMYSLNNKCSTTLVQMESEMMGVGVGGKTRLYCWYDLASDLNCKKVPMNRPPASPIPKQCKMEDRHLLTPLEGHDLDSLGDAFSSRNTAELVAVSL